MLDAYQGPYKDKFYNWTGVQLLLRAVFYGISALDRKTNMLVGIVVLGALESIYGTKSPYKNKANNFQELFLFFNAQILFATSMYTTSNSTAVNILVGLALFQFASFAIYRLALRSKLKGILSLVPLVRKHFVMHFSFRQPVSSQDLELHNRIPDVHYNYKEFQEPLVRYE